MAKHSKQRTGARAPAKRAQSEDAANSSHRAGDANGSANRFEQFINALTEHFVVDAKDIRRSLERIASSFQLDIAAEGADTFFNPPFTLLVEALEHLPANRALDLVNGEDLKCLTNRLRAADYLCQEKVPLYSLSELGQHLTEFIKYLERDRDHLIKTGLPQKCFRPCRWLYQQLARLYDIKATESPGPHDEYVCSRTGSHEPPAYQWVRYLPYDNRLGIEAVRAEKCTYEDADLLRNIVREDSLQLEAGRSQLFDLKITILQELRDAISHADSSLLWRKCLKAITDTILADQADFYLRMDHFYMQVDARRDGAAKANPKTIPGGLTNLLEVIGHCEKEIDLGTFATTRETFGHLITREGRFQNESECLGNPYYRFYGSKEQVQLDAGLDQFLSLSSKELDFWSDLRQRVNQALETEFSAEVITRTRVKRNLVVKFEPQVQAMADLCKAQLEATGQSPMVSLSPSMATTGKSSVRREGRKGSCSPNQPWTQANLDQAIRGFKTENKQLFDNAVKDLAGARKQAKKVFGRNAIAKKLRVKARAMVSKSSVWQEIAAALTLDCKATRKLGSYRIKKVGLDVALDDTTQANEPASAPLEREETFAFIEAAIRNAAKPEVVEALQELKTDLQTGKRTHDEVHSLLERFAEQQRDMRSEKMR